MMKERCEMCGIEIECGFSLCDECGDKVDYFDEKTGLYVLKDGQVIDTTKHQF